MFIDSLQAKRFTGLMLLLLTGVGCGSNDGLSPPGPDTSSPLDLSVDTVISEDEGQDLDTYPWADLDFPDSAMQPDTNLVDCTPPPPDSTGQDTDELPPDLFTDSHGDTPTDDILPIDTYDTDSQEIFPEDSLEDVSTDDGSGTDIDGPVQYPPDRTHSPITPWVKAHLQALSQNGSDLNEAVFMKAGDSISVTSAFMYCFAGSAVELDQYAELQPTIDYFVSSTVVGGTTPFDRPSIATLGGKTASWVISGDPSPLLQEIDALSPAIAVIMFGTNDMAWFEDQVYAVRWYAENMLALMDELLARGIVPILTSIPPRTDSVSLGRWVPTINEVVRGLAQGFQIPFVDYYSQLLPLPDYGLWPDGVHPDPYYDGGEKACVFTPEGLQHGQNVHNLVVLQALHRAHTVLTDAAAPDAAGEPVVVGAGSHTDPFVISALPFTDLRSTSDSANSLLDGYPECDNGQDESGPEYVYQLTLPVDTPIRAMVFDRSGVDIDLHLLDENQHCLARNDTAIQMTLAAGTYGFVLDTYVSGNTSYPGEYLMVVLACEPDDPDCW